MLRKLWSFNAALRLRAGLPFETVILSITKYLSVGLLLWSFSLQADTITTVAGSSVAFAGGAGSGDGGIATAANLQRPKDVAVDGAGNLYIATLRDPAGWELSIRKVNAATNIISTLHSSPEHVTSVVYSLSDSSIYYGFIMPVNGAGVRRLTEGGVVAPVASGIGYMGEYPCREGFGGPATALSSFLVYAMDIDLEGSNLYIVDPCLGAYPYERARLWRVSGGIATIVAGSTRTVGPIGDGGQATAATLERPHSVASAGGGIVYIAEPGRIRKFGSSGFISTVISSADVGGAAFGAIAASGELLYVRCSDAKIRQLYRGVISVVAGNGTAGYSGDGGDPARASIASSGGLGLKVTVVTPRSGRAIRTAEIYLAEADYHIVRKVTLVQAPVITSFRTGVGTVRDLRDVTSLRRGDRLLIRGDYFGDAPGTVTFSGVSLFRSIGSWTNVSVAGRISSSASFGTFPVVLTTSDGRTVSRSFTIAP